MSKPCLHEQWNFPLFSGVHISVDNGHGPGIHELLPLMVFVVFITEVAVLKTELVIVMAASWLWISWESWVLSIVSYKLHSTECNGSVSWVEVFDETGAWDNETWGCNVSDIGELELISMADVFWCAVLEDPRSLVKS